MEFVFVYMTTANRDEALKIGRALVEERLAACANIFDNMTSIYHWDNKICTDNEAVLIAKTTAQNFEKLAARVKELHSYECPCIISMPITDGNQNYLEWLKENTGG